MSRLRSNILALTLLQASSYLFPLVTLPYLTRTLGSERYGLLLYAQAVITYFMVLTEYGFGLSATRLISINRHDRERVAELFWATVSARLALMVVSAVVLILILVSVPRLRADLPIYGATFLTVIASAILPVWYFQGIEQMRELVVTQLIARLLGVIGIFALVHGPSDLTVAALVQGGSPLVAAAASLLLMWRLAPVQVVVPSLREVFASLKDGWSVFSSTVVISLYTTTNTVLLGSVGGNQVVGYFGAADKIISAAKGLLYPLRQAIFPHLSRLASERPHEARNQLKRIIVYIVPPFALISAILMVFPDRIVGVLFGVGFEPAVALLRIMSLVPLIVAAGTCLATFFMLGFGYPTAWQKLIFCASGVNFLVLAMLAVFLPLEKAVAFTVVTVEAFVLCGSWIFFWSKRKVPA